MDRIPLLLYGDGPRLQSGLARIARDLAMRLVAEQDELGIRFVQVGVDYGGGWHWQPWDFYGFLPTEKDQGRGAVAAVVEELRRDHPTVEPIIWAIMDPSRVYDLTRTKLDGEAVEIETERIWGYFPIDAYNLQEAVGGPAAAAIHTCERVLGYGRFGAQVLQRTLQMKYRRGFRDRDQPSGPVQYLPHGIDTQVWRPGVGLEHAHEDFRQWAREIPTGAIKIGAVATNQPRKDLGLLFATVAALRQRGYFVALWLHTDLAVKHWSIGELAHTCGLPPHLVAVSTAELTDTQLAAQYGWSDLTIAPGLGEGFCYPIVESLACGTPVVHGHYAGGVELIPRTDWLVPPVAWRLESVYAVQRPVFDPKQVAATVLQVAEQVHAQPDLAAYCAGSVAHLDWQYLWPRWRGWITKGLRAGVAEPQKELVRG